MEPPILLAQTDGKNFCGSQTGNENRYQQKEIRGHGKPDFLLFVHEDFHIFLSQEIKQFIAVLVEAVLEEIFCALSVGQDREAPAQQILGAHTGDARHIFPFQSHDSHVVHGEQALHHLGRRNARFVDERTAEVLQRASLADPGKKDSRVHIIELADLLREDSGTEVPKAFYAMKQEAFIRW